MTVAKRARPARKRQAEIIEVAARVFHERGYESTSIQDIATAVGILKGSLYYYIDSKEDLLFEILKDVHEGALKSVERAEAFAGDPLQKIRCFVEGHALFNAENVVKVSVFFQDFRSLSEDRRRLIVEERDAHDALLRRLIAEGQSEGLICPDVDPKLSTLLILGATAWISRWFQPRGEKSASGVAATFSDFIVAGLACSPDSHVPGHRSALAATGGLPPQYAPAAGSDGVGAPSLP